MEDITKFIIGPGGNIASVVGLIITIIGFVITIYTTLKSKTAAHQAEKMVIRMREDIRKVDTIGELSSAIAIMDEIKRLHRKEAWNMLPDRYSALKKLLISIKSANPNITDKQKATLQGAIQHFTSIDKDVERSLALKKDLSDVHRLNQVVSQQVDNLMEILVEIRSTVGD